MRNEIQRINCEDARQIDLVNLLEKYGHHPVKIRRNDYWYLSPLRKEKTASFKVNRTRNIWYDHGIGKGGTVIDFAVLYFNCSVPDALQKLDSGFSFHRPPTFEQIDKEPGILIEKETSLHSLSLLKYLHERRIADLVATQYCKEINFTVNKKTYPAIGFRNNEGGYELRNSWFKGSSAPKAITTLQNGFEEAFIFEGFFDFLSFRTINNNQPPAADYLILNSASFFEQCKPWLEQHTINHLLLDNDATGKRLTELAFSWGNNYRDESGLYKGYKDLNDWVQKMGKNNSKGLRL